MSAPEVTAWEDGKLQGALYLFADKNDELPLHTHVAETNHITVVIRGAITAFGLDWEENATSGNILSFTAGVPHRIVATEDDTLILNILKGA